MAVRAGRILLSWHARKVRRAAAAVTETKWRREVRRPGRLRSVTAGAQQQLGRASMCSYLVDPASSHMLVSKIKPCMCQYTPL